MRIEADVAVATSESLAELQLESSASTSCTRSSLRAVCLDRFTTSLSCTIMIYTCISPRGRRYVRHPCLWGSAAWWPVMSQHIRVRVRVRVRAHPSHALKYSHGPACCI
ncbi:hypothetical protein L226DRAFT_366666 [Lentinus tigrinus ALCF2SS1-7]|uniref:uncharacterized protein n=1 Tax=Lentinus tigrinus ALCF2SS1-7 TaxID=1328758 RepID=UPI0011661AFE|nr:hypothetical protein L226DRAFT_366666 [Lentinus tigrinus ALCF2SS1-7]